MVETDKIDSNSVYDSTSANDAGANKTDDAAIIDDVASVVTGVENADVEVFDRADVISQHTVSTLLPALLRMSPTAPMSCSTMTPM